MRLMVIEHKLPFFEHEKMTEIIRSGQAYSLGYKVAFRWEDGCGKEGFDPISMGKETIRGPHSIHPDPSFPYTLSPDFLSTALDEK